MPDKHKHRREYEYADELNDRREEKRSRMPELHNKNEKKKKKMSGSCCVLVVVILGMAFYLIYFVVSQLSGPIQEEWAKRKVDLEKLPETIEQLKSEAEKMAEEGKTNMDGADNAIDVIVEKPVETDDTIPGWMFGMILSNEHYAPRIRCDYQGEKIYVGKYFDKECSDCFTDQIFDQNGIVICSTSGGIGGNGDGRCPSLPAAATNCQIWNSERWENTVWE